MTDLSNMTREQLEAMVAKLTAAAQRKLTCKVSEKGCLSVYGMGRNPTSLYKSQWEALIAFIKSGALEEFIKDNSHLLKVKGE